jgi:hypothetical protein
VIRAVEMTGRDVPIGLVLHTPGGLVLAAEQVAAALAAHPARVTVYVPHYAMSGGTMIALAADHIVMAASAVLGPVDPQIGEFPVASILAAVARKDPNEVDDRTLIYADVGRKAQQQVEAFLGKLLARLMSPENAQETAHLLSEGRWTHDFPIDVEHARSLGLPVSTDLPDEVRLLMSLYPQPRGPTFRRVHPHPLRVPAEPRTRQPGRRVDRGRRECIQGRLGLTFPARGYGRDSQSPMPGPPTAGRPRDWRREARRTGRDRRVLPRSCGERWRWQQCRRVRRPLRGCAPRAGDRGATRVRAARPPRNASGCAVPSSPVPSSASSCSTAPSSTIAPGGSMRLQPDRT